jgi:hypothetical protein
LEPVAEGVGDLAHLLRYDGADCGFCFSTYTNALGGRVAVSTYAPWHRLGRGAKRHQVLAVADWLAREQLPLRIEQPVRAVPWVRQSSDGTHLAVVLLNSALDPSGPLTLRLRARPQSIALIAGGQSFPLDMQRLQGEVVVSVPSVPAWQTAVLLGT